MAMSMRNNRLIITPGVIRGVAIAALWIGIGVYFGWHLYSLFRAPVLVVENPPRDIITQDTSIILFGHAQKESEVTINGSHMDTGQDGLFRETIELEDGMNILEMRVVNKFGKETVIVRRVVRE